MSKHAQTDTKRRAYRRGHMAEWLAAWWLRLKGYRILARRYATPVGEIDLIVKRGATVAFVEVKARASFEQALNAVSPRQRQRIVRAALYWQGKAARAEGVDMRFDLMLVNRFGLLRHHQNAFDAG